MGRVANIIVVDRKQLDRFIPLESRTRDHEIIDTGCRIIRTGKNQLTMRIITFSRAHNRRKHVEFGTQGPTGNLPGTLFLG